MSKTNESLTPQAIIVQTKTAERFFRAGHQFGREPVEIPADALTEQQLEAIVSEPQLLVSFVAEDFKAAKAAAAAAAAKKAEEEAAVKAAANEAVKKAAAKPAGKK